MQTAMRRISVTITLPPASIDNLAALSIRYDQPRSRVIEDLLTLAINLPDRRVARPATAPSDLASYYKDIEV